MDTNPIDFFETFVYANYIDCKNHKGNIRYAFNAAVSASHLADHYFNYFKRHDRERVKQFKSIGFFVEFLTEQTGVCFKDIRSISNAYKHLYTSTDPKKATYSTIYSPGVVESISFNASDLELERVELTDVLNADESRVVFTRKDGSRSDFFTTLETVINFWSMLCFEPPLNLGCKS